MLVRVGPRLAPHERDQRRPEQAVGADRERARSRGRATPARERRCARRSVQRRARSTQRCPSSVDLDLFVSFGRSVSCSVPPAQLNALTTPAADDVAVRDRPGDERREPCRLLQASTGSGRTGWAARLVGDRSSRRTPRASFATTYALADREAAAARERDLTLRDRPWDESGEIETLGRCGGFQNRCCQTTVPVREVAVVDVGDVCGGSAVDPVAQARRRARPARLAVAVWTRADAATVPQPSSRRTPTATQLEPLREHEHEEQEPPRATATAVAGASRAGRRAGSRCRASPAARPASARSFHGAVASSASNPSAEQRRRRRADAAPRGRATARRRRRASGGSAARSRPSRCGANRAANEPDLQRRRARRRRVTASSARAAASRSRPRTARRASRTSAPRGTIPTEMIR